MAKKNDSKSTPVPTFDYLRKSTKGEVTEKDGSKRQRQEKSISQQRKELDKLGLPREIEDEGYSDFQIVGTFTDEGVSGWKLGNKRPGFQRMIEAIKKCDAKHKVIRVDEMDRFSRADIKQTQEVANELERAGVRWIISASQGVFDLGASGNDIVAHMRFALAAWSNNDYSRRLGRRIALSRCNKAAEGKRSGGMIPFGMVSDGNDKLKPGDPNKIAQVRQIFDWFTEDLKSLTWIVNHLNSKGIPSPGNGKWHATTLGEMLARPAYVGTFRFGDRPLGQFYHIDSDGTVSESDGSQKNENAAFTKEDAWEGIIGKKQFAKAAKRLAGFKAGKKPRHDGLALTGILWCGHCGKKMYGTKLTDRKSKPTVYRCGTATRQGKHACKNYQIPEDRILPFLLAKLGEEIDNLTQVLPSSPPEYTESWIDRPTHLESEIAELQRKIDQGTENLMYATDPRTLEKMNEKIQELWAELETKQAEFSSYCSSDREAQAIAEHAELLREWWDGIKDSLVPVSISMDSDLAKKAFPEKAAQAAEPAPWDDWVTALIGERPAPVMMVEFNQRGINEALHDLGARVDLYWRSEMRNVRLRHLLKSGRFRLGQQSGELSGSVVQELSLPGG